MNSDLQMEELREKALEQWNRHNDVYEFERYWANEIDEHGIRRNVRKIIKTCDFSDFKDGVCSKECLDALHYAYYYSDYYVMKYLCLYCEITIDDLRTSLLHSEIFLWAGYSAPYSDCPNSYCQYNNNCKYGCPRDTWNKMDIIKFLCEHFEFTDDDVHDKYGITLSRVFEYYSGKCNEKNTINLLKYLCNRFDFTKKDAINTLKEIMSYATIDTINYLCKKFKLTIGDVHDMCLHKIQYCGVSVLDLTNSPIFNYFEICGIKTIIYSPYNKKNCIQTSFPLDTMLHDNYIKSWRNALKGTDFDKCVSEQGLHDNVISYL